MNKTPLFTEFPPVSTETWKSVIQKDLKGADYNRLMWKTANGFAVRPYYRAQDLDKLEFVGTKPNEFPFVRGTKNDNQWEVRQDIVVENVEIANKTALDCLMKGATSIAFLLKNPLSEVEFETLLKDIAIDCIELNFNSYSVTNQLFKEVQKRKLNFDTAKGAFEVDSIGEYSLKGETIDFQSLINQIKTVNKNFPSYKTIAVNGTYFHNSGASVVQELAFALAVGSEYLSQLTDLQLDSDTIAKSMKFTFSVGSNYFMEIAKFRAARMLWANVVNAYQAKDVNSAKMAIHAQTSHWNLSTYDSYVNMLRTTTESMSAVIAGVDSLTVTPFDAHFRHTSEFSERIARNTQLILKEEAHLDKVTDISAGSYYIENLTHSIAVEAWKVFQEIEKQGGYLKAFQGNVIQDIIEKSAQQRDINIATRREILVGTNQYPNFNEKVENTIDFSVYTTDTKTDSGIKLLKPYRGAKAFEKLRLETEHTGKTPKVFMLTYGNLAMRKARAMFSCNFFACAGYQVVDNNGFTSIEEGIKASIEAKADVVVICSSDEEYAQIAIPIFEALKDKTIVVVAGYPKDSISTLQEAGIQHFIHVRTNVLETLKEFQSLVFPKK